MSQQQLMFTANRHKIATLPTLSPGEQHPDFVEVQNYLRRYGYLPVDAEMRNSQLDLSTADALARFQRFFGIANSGQFDRDTRNLMAQPRCGMPDFPEAEFRTIGAWSRRDLTFAFGPVTGQAVGAPAAMQAVRRAFATWTAAGAGLRFTEVQTTQHPDMQIEWRSANDPDHSMTGGTLAHADFPPGFSIHVTQPPLPLHFDDTEHTWNVGAQYDIETVALHEIGHCLGMLHESGVPGAVMFPAYSGIRTHLSSDDVTGINNLYPIGPKRFNAIWLKSNKTRPAVWGWARPDFDKRQAELHAQGYRLEQLNAFVLPNGQGERFNAIWSKSNEDRPALWGWARTDFDKRQAELHAQGYRLTDLNAFVLPNGQGERFNAIWLKSNESRPAVWGWARADFDKRQAELHAQGYRLLKLNAFVLPNGQGERFNAIWLKSSESRPAVWGWARTDFDKRQAELHAQGYRLVDLNTFVLPNGQGERFNAIWSKSNEGPPGFVGLGAH